MNPTIKKRWIKALRSGEYKQTKAALKRGKNSYCCLGVLCDLAPASVGEWDNYTFDAGKNRDASMLPEPVNEWAGLTDEEENELAHKNDWGASFEEIADYIEANL